ncbi:MAG: hypothetical protein N3A54_03860, partial [Patescibacteria group bacterium]|nr:hypothetical protein [Patescibacteria group bacterium]
MPTMDFDDFEDFENDDERINKEIDDYLKKLEKSMKDDDLSIVKKSSEEIMNQSNLLLDKFLNACYGELVSVLKIAGEFDQAEYMKSV